MLSKDFTNPMHRIITSIYQLYSWPSSCFPSRNPMYSQPHSNHFEHVKSLYSDKDSRYNISVGICLTEIFMGLGNMHSDIAVKIFKRIILKANDRAADPDFLFNSIMLSKELYFNIFGSPRFPRELSYKKSHSLYFITLSDRARVDFLSCLQILSRLQSSYYSLINIITVFQK